MREKRQAIWEARPIAKNRNEAAQLKLFKPMKGKTGAKPKKWQDTRRCK